MKHSHLPHIDMKEHYQFITFRTADSTDSFLLKLETESKPNRERQMAMDAYLDASEQGAYLYDDVLRFFFDFIRSKDGDLYKLVCFAVMPNHVHLLINPLHKLPMVIQRLKGASAKGINDMLGRHGAFWEKDYYDKVIRDEDHFRVVYQYIKNNALKLNVATSSGGAALAAQVDVTKKKLLSATKVAPPGVGASGGAAQGECCSQQREHPGVSAAHEVSDQVRFYGIYDA